MDRQKRDFAPVFESFSQRSLQVDTLVEIWFYLHEGVYDDEIVETEVCRKCYTEYGSKSMPSKNPRINIVVEPPLYDLIEQRAERQGVSMSLVTRDLIKEALEMEEDIALSQLAEERETKFREETALSHDDVWN